MKKHTLLQGITILGAAAITSKLLGTLQKIPMQNLAGDLTFGIYSTVYPFYTLILFLATAGLPIAVSKFVAERYAENDVVGKHNILKASVTFIGFTSFAGFCILYFAAPTLADWIGNSQTIPALRSVSVALLIVPGLAVLRGYFQGKQNMTPSAKSQIIEQFVRVIVILIVLFTMTKTHFIPQDVAAGAMYGSVAGGFVALLYMCWEWYRDHHAHPHEAFTKQSTSYTFAYSFKTVLLYALPICLGAIVPPILNIVDTFTLPRMFQLQGFGEWGAMELYGVYSRGLVLTQFIILLFSSISVAIVPAMVAARARNDDQEMGKQIATFVRFTWYFGMAASVGLWMTAKPINVMLFEDEVGTTAMAILGISVIFSVLNIITTSFLQGWGKERLPVYHLLIAVMVKLIGNLLLVPQYGVNGAAISMLAAFFVAALLNTISLRHEFKYLNLQRGLFVIKTLIALLVMSFVVWLTIISVHVFLPTMASDRFEATVSALLAIVLGATVYIFTLLKVKAITPADFSVIPSVERAMQNALDRLKFPNDRMSSEGE
jgi:O-antigen/teichoic acid export membrane protein